MRIVILGTAWPYRGGLSAFNERMALQFQNEGHEVHILTFTLQYPKLLFPGKTQYASTPAPEGLDIQRTMNSIGPWSWCRTGKVLRKLKPDLVVVKFWLPLMAPCLGYISRLARKITGVSGNPTKVVSVLDNVIPHEPHFWDRWLIRYFVNSVDRFVAMSDSVLKDCERFDQHKPKRLCPHPLYDIFGTPVSKADACAKLNLDPSLHYLLFFGFIRDYKGLDLLMKAYADPRLRQHNVRLLVAGEYYNNGEQYAALEKELGLEGKIIWHNDFIPDDEVRFYFGAADMIVQPYKSATQSGVTQIAYHFEKPMLVTNVGGLAEIVPNGKVGYVTEVDANAIADALVDFCHNDYPSFSEGLRHEKLKYSWQRMTAAILNQPDPAL